MHQATRRRSLRQSATCRVDQRGDAGVVRTRFRFCQARQHVQRTSVPAQLNCHDSELVLVCRLEYVSSGYYTGKKMAETAVNTYAKGGTSAVVLKPSAVFGTRFIGESQVPLPLGLVFQPLRFFMRIPTGGTNNMHLWCLCGTCVPVFVSA